MPRAASVMYAATGRFVVALDPRNGAEVWRAKLPTSLGTNVTTLLLKGNVLYVGRGGRVYCLDARSGTILWENGLPKTGHGAVLMVLEGAVGGDSAAVAGAVQLSEDAQQASSA